MFVYAYVLTTNRYLIHEPWNLHDDYHNAWQAMEQIKKAGKTKSIGVSNFVRKDFEIILDGASDPPVVNQLEYHPHIQRINNGIFYIPWMQENGIQVEAFKGLTPLARCPEGPLVEPLARMAKRHGTTATAVMLRWYLQQDVVAVTTTRKEERLEEYAAALNVELSKQELDEITRLGQTHWHRFYFPERYADGDRS